MFGEDFFEYSGIFGFFFIYIYLLVLFCIDIGLDKKVFRIIEVIVIIIREEKFLDFIFVYKQEDNIKDLKFSLRNVFDFLSYCFF